MSLKPNTTSQKVQYALYYLRAARDLLKSADAPKATAKVRLAISSAEGALRHADLEQYREARQHG